jgi:dipeptidyl aminopeptidase/acylaminoacyl peptidase
MTGDSPARIPITQERLRDLRLAGDLHLSRDGSRVAFELIEIPPGQNTRRTRIWTVEASGGEAKPLTSGKRSDTCPRWAPDSKSLAFISRGDGNEDRPQVQLISAAGGDVRQVCAMPNGVSDLGWSPDGNRLAFISPDGEEPGSDPRVLLPGEGRHHRLWTVRADDDIPVAVTPEGITVWEYAWSPDGRQIALYFSRRPDDSGWYHGQIGVVDAEGGAVRQLTQFPPVSIQARALAWSPDGQQLAYVSGKWSDPGRGAGDITVLTVADGQSRNVTPGIGCSPTWCDWFPDGHRLLFTAVDGVSHQIGIVQVDDGAVTALDRSFVMLRDQPRLSVTPDLRRFATVHSTSQQPPEVYSGALATESDGDGDTAISWQRLTRLNPIPEETWSWAASVAVHFPGVDGHLVHGLFSPPVASAGGALPPLYVQVHGGPSGADCDSCAVGTAQILPSVGYAVLRVNYRGSWGNGAEFADAVMGDVGGKDLQDILAGIDYLLSQGLVDGDRLAIGGWSNGGFLSAWAVTQTRRFRAALMGAGISDWLNMHAQSNIPDSDVLQLGVDPIDRPEVYQQHSPLTFARDVRTPTLIQHGESDPAVPVAQAYAFYRALSERGIPVEMAVYPREGHGLRELDHMSDATNRLLRWLDQYVKGP